MIVNKDGFKTALRRLLVSVNRRNAVPFLMGFVLVSLVSFWAYNKYFVKAINNAGGKAREARFLSVFADNEKVTSPTTEGKNKETLVSAREVASAVPTATQPRGNNINNIGSTTTPTPTTVAQNNLLISVTPTPTLIPSVTIIPSPTLRPTVVPTATPTQAPIPTATPTVIVKRNIGVNLLREGNFTQEGAGSVNIEITNTYSSGFIDLNLSGNLNRLMPNRIYQVWICDSSNCSTNANPVITTDGSGNAGFSGVIFALNLGSNPNQVRVYEKLDAGPIPTDPTVCGQISTSSTPCLSGAVYFN